MRNLKKFLALVLAMAMAFSLMLSASAADVKYSDYKDKDSVSEQFEEAARVLTGLGVLQGDENTELRPGDTITRAEAAAIVYRIATGDVTDKQKQLYSDYGRFTDVPQDSWFAGYVGYCNNAGIIKGRNASTFDPYGKVTGYEVLAMILRAAGYGQQGEFTGSDWQVNVASLAKTKHVSDSVLSGDFAYTLNQYAPRQVVAELMFRGSLLRQVKWTPGLGYVEYENGQQDRTNSLAWDVFRLHQHGWQAGTWGDPYYTWNVWTKNWSTDTEIARIEAKPVLTFHDTMIECDVAHDENVDITDSADFDLYVNGNFLTAFYHIEATDTVTKVGGQGRLVKVYRDLEAINVDQQVQEVWRSPFTNDDVITMVDTFLGKVTSKTDAVLDRNDHVITPARLYVDVYDQLQLSATAPNPSKRIISKPADSKDNWEFNAGDMVTFNAVTEPVYGISDRDSNGTIIDGQVNHTLNDSMANRAAYERERVRVNRSATAAITASNYTGNTDGSLPITARNVTLAESMQGKQTITYWNAGKHTVEGTDIPDQLDLFYDVAGTTVNTNFTWYKDGYGNIIGIGPAGSTQYGVITSAYASFNQGDTNTDGTTKAIVTARMSSGEDKTFTISRFLVNAKGVVPATPAAGDHHLMPSGATAVQMTNAANTLELVPIYDYNDNAGGVTTVMKGQTTSVTATATGDAANRANLFMSPVAGINNTVEGGTGNHNQTGYYGIITGNLFKFVESANGTVTAIEVAGTAAVPSTNSPLYDNHHNGLTAADATAGIQVTGRLYKSLGYISFNTGAEAANVSQYLETNAKIIVRNPDTGAIKVYDGLDGLPNDVLLDEDTEVDWVDEDDNNRAEVVYLTGRINGITTYNLFFFNGRLGAAQWDGTKGTVAGYLNGVAETVTFTNKTLFDLLNTSQTYRGRLFALEITDGIVTNVMARNNSTTPASDDYMLLAESNITADMGSNNVRNSNAGVWAAAGFQFPTNTVGANTVNPANPAGYTTVTRAVYVRDTGANVTYSQVDQTIDVGGTKYYLNTGAVGTKVVGDLLEYLNEAGRENDITMVYEQSNINAVTQIYVTTDPDWTPAGTANAVTFDVTINANRSLGITRYVDGLPTNPSTDFNFAWAAYLTDSTGVSGTLIAGSSGNANWSVAAGALATSNATVNSIATTLNSVTGQYVYATITVNGTTYRSPVVYLP